MQLDIPLDLNFFCVTMSGFYVSTFAAGKTVCIESISVSKSCTLWRKGRKRTVPVYCCEACTLGL